MKELSAKKYILIYLNIHANNKRRINYLSNFHSPQKLKKSRLFKFIIEN